MRHAVYCSAAYLGYISPAISRSSARKQRSSQDTQRRSAMTETRSKSTNPFEFSKFANFDLSKFEVPPAFREYVDGAVAQAKRSYEKMKTAAEEATELLESTYTTATKGASDDGMKVIEATRTNTNAIFDFAEKLLTGKTPAEVAALANSHASK
jgi:hypothetical protein